MINHRTRLLLPTVFVILFSVTACAAPVSSSQPTTVTVMAAASLTEAFNELAPVFEQAHPGATLQFNFANSQQLVQQLAGGAVADVFASANQKQMGAAVLAGRVDAAAPCVFVRNQLVIIHPADNPAGLAGLADLARPGLKLVLAASEVPVGQYSLDFLDKAVAGGSFEAGYKDAVLANVVSYEENVKSVLAKVSLGEADGGIVYTSDITGDAAQKVGRLDIPDELNVIASYPVAVINDAPNADLAQAFVDFLFSEAGRAVLQKYGFLPPE